jgi:hypothetical protein
VNVEWLPIALADRDSQLDYIAKRNARAAIDMATRSKPPPGAFRAFPTAAGRAG